MSVSSASMTTGLLQPDDLRAVYMIVSALNWLKLRSSLKLPDERLTHQLLVD